LETFVAVRKVWPERLPLTARLSVTDWIDGGVTVEESIELIRRLKDAGLDLIDVSQGFNTPDISKVPWGPGFMIPVASRIRREAGVPTAVGWMITEAQQAEEALRDHHTDLVMLAREMLRDPYWPFHAAQKLGMDMPQQVLPVQYALRLKQ
jgi:2,4-dienoyl-CoA reductase-like NADH-dependent reductase (Old Yellow Enzyme family)